MTMAQRQFRAPAGAVPIPFANKIAILGNSIIAQNMPWNQAAQPVWIPGTSYASGASIVPPSQNLVGGYKHLEYHASAGTSGTIEPIWPSVVGGTVTDNGITWTAFSRGDQSAFLAGYWTLAQCLSGQRLDEVWMGGYSSQQSPAILSRLPAALAANPDIIYFANMFENDCWPGSAPAPGTILANWNAFAASADYVRALGKRVMVNTVMPNGSIDASAVLLDIRPEMEQKRGIG